MLLRVASPVLALTAVVVGAAGLPGAASDLLLVAIVVTAALGLQAVVAVVDGARSRASGVVVGLGLLSLVAAGATERPELALGCVACAALGRVQLRFRVREPIPE